MSDEEARACALQFAVAIRDGSTDAERILADARIFADYIMGLSEVEVEFTPEKED